MKETVMTVTQWANSTFGEANLDAQMRKAFQEIEELKREYDRIKGERISTPLTFRNTQQLVMEAADVCICLYRLIGSIDPLAIDNKMAINRKRLWNLKGDGTAQHAK